MQAYSDPKRESDPHALPDIEVFHVGPGERDECPLCLGADPGDCDDDGTPDEHEHATSHVGYYWWPCFPGCLPDSDPCGPFASASEALADAREGVDYDEDDDEGAAQ